MAETQRQENRRVLVGLSPNIRLHVLWHCSTSPGRWDAPGISGIVLGTKEVPLGNKCGLKKY